MVPYWLALGATGAAIWFLSWLGHGALALPSPAMTSTWVGQNDITIVVFTVVRGVALLAAWWVLSTLLFGPLLRLARLRTLGAAVDALTLPIVRRITERAVGLSLAGAL